jgi:hypothetical protein
MTISVTRMKYGNHFSIGCIQIGFAEVLILPNVMQEGFRHGNEVYLQVTLFAN